MSFVYNVGPEAFRRSTMLRLLRANKPEAAAGQFGRWVKNSEGETLSGLVRRRAAEKELFLLK